VRQGFVYGAFVDGVIDCGPGDEKDCTQEINALGSARATAYQEMLRPRIAAALATW
jgi:hypothetical protein